MKYKIVEGFNVESIQAKRMLENRVNSLIKDGWKLQGGVAMIRGEGGFYLMTQAMIKEDK